MRCALVMLMQMIVTDVRGEVLGFEVIDRAKLDNVAAAALIDIAHPVQKAGVVEQIEYWAALNSIHRYIWFGIYQGSADTCAMTLLDRKKTTVTGYDSGHKIFTLYPNRNMTVRPGQFFGFSWAGSQYAVKYDNIAAPNYCYFDTNPSVLGTEYQGSTGGAEREYSFKITTIEDPEVTTVEPQATTVEPTTIQPTTIEATTTQPTTLQPTTTETTTSLPTATEQITTTEQTTTTEPTTTEPFTTESGTTEWTTKEPTTVESTTGEASTAAPTTIELTTTEPTTTQSIVTEPITTEPITTQPTTKKPTTAETTVGKQAITTSQTTANDPLKITTILQSSTPPATAMADSHSTMTTDAGSEEKPPVPKKDLDNKTYTLDWYAWTPWTSCTKTCEGGTRLRLQLCSQASLCKRELAVPNGNNLGYHIQTELCRTQPCRGAWSMWSVWAPKCTNSCLSLVQKRLRTCLTPEVECEGKTSEVNVCPQEECDRSANIVSLADENGFTPSDFDIPNISIGTTAGLTFLIGTSVLFVVMDIGLLKFHYYMLRYNLTGEENVYSKQLETERRKKILEQQKEQEKLKKKAKKKG